VLLTDAEGSVFLEIKSTGQDNGKDVGNKGEKIKNKFHLSLSN